MTLTEELPLAMASPVSLFPIGSGTYRAEGLKPRPIDVDPVVGDPVTESTDAQSSSNGFD